MKPRNTRSTRKGGLRFCASVSSCLCVISAAKGRCSAVFKLRPRDPETRRQESEPRNTRSTRKGGLRLCASVSLCLCVNSAAQERCSAVFNTETQRHRDTEAAGADGGDHGIHGKECCGSVPLCLRVSVLIPRRRGVAALFSTQRPRGTETRRRPDGGNHGIHEKGRYVSVLISAAQGRLFRGFSALPYPIQHKRNKQ